MKVKLSSLVEEFIKIRFPDPTKPPTTDQLAQLENEVGTDASKLKDAQLAEITTARNRELISAEEQTKLRNTVVGFFGLSVGSHAALTWMMLSRAHHIVISDPDTIDASNLNRLRSPIASIGKQKVAEVTEHLLGMQPYCQIRSITTTDTDSIEQVFASKPPISVIVDAVDDMKAKITLRRLARKNSIPLISAIDVGDNVFLDVERHDSDRNQPFFLDRVPGIESVNLDSLTGKEKTALLIKLVGLEHNSAAMLRSLLSIGTTIPTWPQLGSTATIAGGVIATTIKKIILGETIPSGRIYLDFDQILDSSYNEDQSIHERERLKKVLVKKLG